MRTKPMPLSAGMAVKNFRNASSPPADATIPATGSFPWTGSLTAVSRSAGGWSVSSAGSGALMGSDG